MHTICNILALIGALCIVATIICFLSHRSRRRQEEKDRQSRPYWKEFQKIAEWSGEEWYQSHPVYHRETYLRFEIVFFIDGKAKNADISDFDPYCFPPSIRPSHWLVHYWQTDETGSTINARRYEHGVVSCKTASPFPAIWTTCNSRRQENQVEVELVDRCKHRMSISTEILPEGGVDWNALLTKAYEVVTHSNGVYHYKYLKLQEANKE